MSVNVAKLIAKNFARFGKPVGVKAAMLTKVTRGPRGATVTAGTPEITTTHTAVGLVVTLTPFQIANTLIANVSRVVMLFGASIAGGAVPAPGDRITIEGTTSTIVNDDGGKRAVARDPAAATYLCQCR